jgi:hypothetical protein
LARRQVNALGNIDARLEPGRNPHKKRDESAVEAAVLRQLSQDRLTFGGKACDSCRHTGLACDIVTGRVACTGKLGARL